LSPCWPVTRSGLLMISWQSCRQSRAFQRC